MALQGWDIMDVIPVSELALTPVNSSISFFANRITQFRDALTAFEIDVESLSDIQKVVGTELYLPGLTRVALTEAEILTANKFAAVQGVPIANMSYEAKQKIPSDIVFVRFGGELIDYNVAISVDTHGQVLQKINTLAGKPMELVIKPDAPARSVTGFMTLNKVAVGQEQTNILGYMTKLLTASLVDSISPRTLEISGENILFVNKFSYVEVSPGIYRASVSAPQAEGEYDISTVIAYQDINIAPKETKMTAIVNPEGYVFSQLSDGKLRIKGASVSLLWLNPSTGSGQVPEWELWPADRFLQKNPVLTDDTGKYSFLVPEGTYKVKATAFNYTIFESEPFSMKQDIVVNTNIELFKKAGWFSWINWQSIITILLVILIGYNIWQKVESNKLKIK